MIKTKTSTEKMTKVSVKIGRQEIIDYLRIKYPKLPKDTNVSFRGIYDGDTRLDDVNPKEDDQSCIIEVTWSQKD